MINNKPVIGIPIGDPAGIGPEIAVKSLTEAEVYEKCNPILIGDEKVIKQAMRFCSVNLNINSIKKAEEGKFTLGTIDLVDLNNIDIDELKIGKIQGTAGKAAFEYIKKSVEMAKEGELDAIATTPINKESLKEGNVNYIGHTEILADLTDTEDPLTMFEVRGMRVFFLTRHVSLRKACDLVTKERVLDYIIRCSKALEKLGVKDGKMAVAGLNPHSGEHGLFGDEEMKAVVPAIEEAQKMGYKVEGPIGADSVFHLALKGRYNSVLSLYHDQGHIATKTLDFERTIAVTNGMPILRTSVDHGTAFDIAGTGQATSVSMVEAIILAAKYSPKFKK
ncbi:4-hydroxythreonine-4-phosphate dehydrogenase PdxA [Clostridium sporogenes]|uniref:Putative D-threonate 4-phosphate dehydrogenase n=1 Tax=Clostridium botulinum TaxID=1491 RepID=A0A6M0SXM7_CLOBO|nr:4-hydroxythreonine-4-phosphate dehydrogenase PdxA [Clostridium sporogenes]EJP6472405.1 4-hydroxythreonine-4-phosphate dehydrogenase PdxA [Clostridium botulinum]NFA60256.1 4-hydroxythreonine-4-phosphate dehydrogenase PdxA [Clostridium botulinum]NFI72936.1 4-hydroxythreonine-4-phosphate dehydrogenase PdxA [Clostridium sporogenes]NFL71412.1 4-hydroxythreonine-4-phosphate dehydrogenase PdxA [Clostridium sporogenes]NFM22977.1 4-hydroxythreonine-4-phosphate dehydrogenase PdxA [Clostridium sporoge